MAIGINWAEVWAPVWKAVWTQSPPIPPTPTPVADEVTGGGFFHVFELQRINRERRKRREREREQELAQIDEPVTQEIAKLLAAQEARDAERADLERIQSMADEYAGKAMKAGLNRELSALVLKAHEERSRNALEQLQRMLTQMLEEEEATIAAIMLLD